MAEYNGYKMLKGLLSSHEIKTYVEELATLNKSHRDVMAYKLAKAGLVYDALSEETICPICFFEKPVNFWLNGRNPKHFHKIESPRCEFVLKCEGRLAFSCT